MVLERMPVVAVLRQADKGLRGVASPACKSHIHAWGCHKGGVVSNPGPVAGLCTAEKKLVSATFPRVLLLSLHQIPSKQ